MAHEGTHTRSKQLEEQIKTMKESMDKIQSDLSERLQQQNEEIRAQIKLQQQHLEKQVVDNQVQLNQITSMLNQLLKEKGIEGASSDTRPGTNQGQNLNLGANSFFNITPTQMAQAPDTKMNFQPIPPTNLSIPIVSSPFSSSMAHTSPLSFQNMRTPPISLNTISPSTSPLLYPTQPLHTPIFTNSTTSPQTEAAIPEIPLYQELHPQIQYIPHPNYPHIPVPIMATPHPNHVNQPLHSHNVINPLHQFTNPRHTVPNNNLPLPRFDFPEFNGTNPRSWLHKCERYFQLHQFPENQKVYVASLHMMGNYDTWVQGTLRPNMQWHEFVQEVIERFEPKSTLGLAGEFNKLKQWADVESYRNKFEELKLLMQRDNLTHDEAYFINSYLSGLKEDLRLCVLTSRPRTLKETYEASIYQELLSEHKKKLRLSLNNKPQPVVQSKNNVNFKNKFVQNQTTSKTTKECYSCGLPWVPGHRCKIKTLNVAMAEENLFENQPWPVESDGEEDEDEAPVEVLLSDPLIDKEKKEVRISLHAIGENKSLDLIRIAGEVNGVPVIALVDSGSTHSFIDPKIVKRAGYKFIPTKPMEITIANC